jgi:protein Tex
MLTTETLFRISQEVGASASRVEATVSLLEGGATVPFIARYRKEATGNLDEVKIQDIDECRLYYTALEQRREAILASIQGQGKLTDDLKQKIEGCFSKGELEDLYLPYKPKRRTKAGEAMRLGLGPLADYIWEQTGNEPVGVYAERFISPPEPEAPTPSCRSSSGRAAGTA